jgi:hypothetical protein
MLNEQVGRKIRERIRAIGISQRVFAALAEICDSELSLTLRGQPVPERVEPRVMAAIESLEDLLRTPNSIVPNLRDVSSINKALQNLAQIRAEESRSTEPIDFEKIALILSAPTLPKVRSDNVEARRVLAGQK